MIPATVTDEALDDLEDFLIAHQEAGGMGLSELDGFLTAIAIGPDLVMPSEWLPMVWGEREPEVSGLDELNAVLATMMARYNEILRDLDAEPDRFEPILADGEDGALSAVEWAAGFAAAMRMREAQWEPLLRDDEARDLFMPILVCLIADDEAKLAEMKLAPGDQLVVEAPLYLPSCVAAIRDFWRDRASHPVQPVRRGPKTGRNDPCPCGSGKKYKRCCGANSP